MDKEKPTSLK